jgi:hypothetical protein
VSSLRELTIRYREVSQRGGPFLHIEVIFLGLPNTPVVVEKTIVSRSPAVSTFFGRCLDPDAEVRERFRLST